MATELRIVVSDAALRDALSGAGPDGATVTAEPAEEGFGESLYPVLVEFGVVAIPTSVAAGVLATWLVEAWKRRGKPTDTVAGVEVGTRSDAIPLSDDDVERIARRLRDLLAEEGPGAGGRTRS